MDLALNNLQRLICHETQTTNQPTYDTYFSSFINNPYKNVNMEFNYDIYIRKRY